MIFRRRPKSSIGSPVRPSKSCPAGVISRLDELPDKLDSDSKRDTTMWPDHRLIDLFRTEFPIVQAPMAGAMDADLVIAAAQGGAIGSLPCAMLSAENAREQVLVIRQRVSAPINMNFSCHKVVEADPAQEAVWKQRLAPYYEELGLDPDAPINAANRAPFDAVMCDVVEELKPEIVSFHYGLPEQNLL